MAFVHGRDRPKGGAILGLSLLLPAAVAAQSVPAAPSLPTVEVVGRVVLPETETPASEVPADVQTLRGSAISSRRALDVTEALNHGANSVTLNDTSGNPFQPDVNLRGFTASPAIGTPQGISVFVDGVRVNEAFADTVNWDLIPAAAIASITVMPGSQPVFGLNTLGGALSVTTKSGFTHPGGEIRLTGGSFGRLGVEFEAGGHGRYVDYYVVGNDLRDAGWADHNPSHVRQLFGKAGYHDADTDVVVSTTLVNNRLEGNQTLPLSLSGQPRQAYTYPDFQTNRLASASVLSTRRWGNDLRLTANMYWRDLDTHVINSNVNNDFDPGTAVGPGNQPTGNVINDVHQARFGGSIQLTSLRGLAGHANRLTVGVSEDRGGVGFVQSNQESGASRDTTSSSPEMLATSLRATTGNTGAYALESFAIDRTTFLTVSARFDRATVSLRDRIGTALDGDHVFQRLNPSIGLTYSPVPAVTGYVSYAEAMRAPSPVELTCADPAAPCSLPNAFASDPALKPVVSRSLEAGLRGAIGERWRWSMAWFDTVLHDDIQFISSGSGATSAGYFRNVGRTRRHGIELALNGAVGPLALSGRYAFIDATFRSPFAVGSPNNSSAGSLACPNCTDIGVASGDRIPGIPRQVLKLRAEVAVATIELGASLLAQSSSYARGDENNRDVNGPVPGFATLDVDAGYSLPGGWRLSGRIANVLNRRYSTFGTLGQNVFTGPGQSFDASGARWRAEQFRSFGAPRGVWVGVSYRFGEKAGAP
ncbi:MAG: TonB-dependent receptor [Caldimonas sp.]